MSSAEYQRQWRARHGATPRRGRPVVEPCGTLAAYRRHLANGEDTCAACRRANADAADILRFAKVHRLTTDEAARIWRKLKRSTNRGNRPKGTS